MILRPSLGSPSSAHSKVANAFMREVLFRQYKDRYEFETFGKDLYRIKLFGRHLYLNFEHLVMLMSELPLWQKYYLPPFSLAGKRVLDAGAGCLESSLLFVNENAKVLAVENDTKCYPLAQINARNLGVNLEFGSFNLQMLDCHYDFMKMDIEGSERVLLDYDRNLPKCVIEAHPRKSGNPNLHLDLCKKFGLKPVYQTAIDVWLLSNV